MADERGFIYGNDWIWWIIIIIIVVCLLCPGFLGGGYGYKG